MTAGAVAPADEVVELLRQLRLPHMRRHAPDVLATAKAQRWEPAEAVRALLAEELAGRQASSINTRRAAAGFPTGKTFDTWDETVSARSPPRHSARWPPWSGSTATRTSSCAAPPAPARPTSSKPSATPPSTTAATSSGSASKRSARSCTATAPTAPPARAIRKLMRADLICVDDIGLLPVGNDTAEALYRVVDAAYEKRSIALSSNLHPAGFDELMPKTIANATVDRLMHHAHVVITTGDSIRLTQATRGKGVRPLAN